MDLEVINKDILEMLEKKKKKEVLDKPKRHRAKTGEPKKSQAQIKRDSYIKHKYDYYCAKVQCPQCHNIYSRSHMSGHRKKYHSHCVEDEFEEDNQVLDDFLLQDIDQDFIIEMKKKYGSEFVFMK
jgi:hypothetical protein